MKKCWVFITLLKRLQWPNLPLFSPSYASSPPQIIFLIYYFRLFTLCLYVFSGHRVKMALLSQGNVPPLSGILFHYSLPDETVLKSRQYLHWPPLASYILTLSLCLVKPLCPSWPKGSSTKFYLFHSFTHQPCPIFKVFLGMFCA